MLVAIDKILNEAKKGGYGVAAPDAYNSPSVQGCFQAALNLKAPLIISCLGTTNMEETAEVTKFYARKHPEAVVTLHLDHGGPFEEIMRALRCGYSSVMIDRSKLVFEENVREVREVVKIAHAMGVTVEAELGHVGTGSEYEETRDSGLTHREEAKRFVEETGVDALAVAVGTSHGVYKGTPRLEFELLRDIAGLVPVPLVLHGGSGTGDENLKKCIQCGIQKINLFTDMADPAGEAMACFMRGESSDDADIAAALDMYAGKKKNFNVAPMVGTEVYRRKLEHYIRLFGSDGKA
ncbi:MAG TPA: class II fructose-bisphosphate aldolase [Candidatus Agathobaculum pullicola]|nr:class II fructose-bisphosphate aldolase [Candidatus Agathobaculum pullicola]